MILNGIEVVKGFNINDKEQAFTEQILAGVKTEETRKSHSLDSLIRKRVAIIRTGRGNAVISAIEALEEQEHYRRFKPLLGFLKELDESEWDDLRVVHFGY